MKSNYAMVIEDDEDLATIFGEALKAAGFEVEVLRDGAVALARLTDTIPEVVVLDLHLPQVGGAEILEAIRADRRMDKTHVMIASADARLADMLSDKVDLVLLKPISFSQLRDLAARLRLLKGRISSS